MYKKKSYEIGSVTFTGHSACEQCVCHATFKFFKGKVKVDVMTGADEHKLEEKIKKWIGDESNDVGVKGHVSAVCSYLVLLIDPS